MLRKITILLALAGTCGLAGAQTETELLVDLDARDASAGTAAWTNRGSLDDFERVGEPKVQTVDGVKAVVFDGKSDTYIGPAATEALEGNAPRTVEAWVLNPRVDSPAETIVSWGAAGPAGGGFSLNIGVQYAAVSLTEKATGLPWGAEHPMEDQWHHLVFTYDGKTWALYDNASRQNSQAGELKTAPGGRIILAALAGPEGKRVFAIPKLLDRKGKPAPTGATTQVGGSIAIAALRIHSVALTGKQVVESFHADAKRFKAVALPVLRKQRAPWPKEMASTFSFGYGSDTMPKDNAQFEKLIVLIKDLGFNVFHGTYTPERLAICKKHGIKMMVDMLSGTDHHVWATPIKWKAAAISLRNNPDIWGYNLWNDPFGNGGGTLRTHVNSLRLWDPTHPAYCGTYHWPAAREITNGDMPGYYDFHWIRGLGYHLRNCGIYMNAARRNNAMWGTWFIAKPGKPGPERVQRSLWSANIGMAHGLKCMLWFLGQDIIDRKTFSLKPGAEDFKAIHAEIMPLRGEIMKIGNPSAVYSTIMTRDILDRPAAKKATAPGLRAFPKDFYVQPLSGEFIAGVFQAKPDSVTLFVANYNAYDNQELKFQLRNPQATATLFDRKTGQWRALPVDNGTVSLSLGQADGELLKIGVDEATRLTTLRKGLVAYYPFDDSFRDLARKNPPAMAKGTAKISKTDMFLGTGAADLGPADGGADTDHLVIRARNALNFDKAFTLTGWCRAYAVKKDTELLANLPEANGRGFAIKMRDNGNWGFAANSSDGQDVLDQVHFDWAYRKYKAEAWCFFAYVVDIKSGSKTLVCYGNRAGQPTLHRAAHALKIDGHLGGIQDFYIARTAAATFDEIAVWNRALTADEVAYLYNRGSGFDCRKLLAPPPKPPAAPRPARSPEAKAAAALKLAKMLLQNKRLDKALPALRQIVRDYPDTPAATEARELLKSTR